MSLFIYGSLRHHKFTINGETAVYMTKEWKSKIQKTKERCVMYLINLNGHINQLMPHPPPQSCITANWCYLFSVCLISWNVSIVLSSKTCHFLKNLSYMWRKFFRFRKKWLTNFAFFSKIIMNHCKYLFKLIILILSLEK